MILTAVAAAVALGATAAVLTVTRQTAIACDTCNCAGA